MVLLQVPPLWPGVPVTLPIAGGQRTWVASESRTGAPGVGQGSRGFPETWRTTRKASFDWTKWSNDAHKTSIKIWLTLWSWPWCACAHVPSCARVFQNGLCLARCSFEELLEKEDDGTGNEPKVNGVGLMEDRNVGPVGPVGPVGLCGVHDTWWSWCGMFHQDPSDVKCYYSNFCYDHIMSYHIMMSTYEKVKDQDKHLVQGCARPTVRCVFLSRNFKNPSVSQLDCWTGLRETRGAWKWGRGGMARCR